MDNYYEILEVSPNASREVIEMAYKALAKKHHPDLNPPENKIQCEENMKILNEIKSTLLNDEFRRQYDYNYLLQENQNYVNSNEPSMELLQQALKIYKRKRKQLIIILIAYVPVSALIGYILAYLNLYSETSYNVFMWIIGTSFALYLWDFSYKFTGKNLFSLGVGIVSVFGYGFYISVIYVVWKSHKIIKLTKQAIEYNGYSST